MATVVTPTSRGMTLSLNKLQIFAQRYKESNARSFLLVIPPAFLTVPAVYPSRWNVLNPGGAKEGMLFRHIKSVFVRNDFDKDSRKRIPKGAVVVGMSSGQLFHVTKKEDEVQKKKGEKMMQKEKEKKKSKETNRKKMTGVKKVDEAKKVESEFESFPLRLYIDNLAFDENGTPIMCRFPGMRLNAKNKEELRRKVDGADTLQLSEGFHWIAGPKSNNKNEVVIEVINENANEHVNENDREVASADSNTYDDDDNDNDDDNDDNDDDDDSSSDADDDSSDDDDDSSGDDDDDDSSDDDDDSSDDDDDSNDDNE